MDKDKPTVGQLERSLSQAIQKLYRTRLGHSTNQVITHLLADKLVIILENSTTMAEKVLIEEGQIALATEVRKTLMEALRPYLRSLIEEILDIVIVDLIQDSILETGRTGIIAIFDRSPWVCNPNTTLKSKPA